MTKSWRTRPRLYRDIFFPVFCSEGPKRMNKKSVSELFELSKLYEWPQRPYWILVLLGYWFIRSNIGSGSSSALFGFSVVWLPQH